MLLEIRFKTNDAVNTAIEESLCKAKFDDEVIGREEDRVRMELSKYISYGEYVVLQFDTLNNNLTVLPQ